MAPARAVDWIGVTARSSTVADSDSLQQLYNSTMYVLCGLICNSLVKPVASKWHMSQKGVATLQAATRS